VEILGGVALSEDEITYSITGLGKFFKDALAVLPSQDIEEGNVVEPAL